MDFDHFRVIGYGLVPDSAGAGRRRGGLGLWRRFRILKDDVNFACYTDRMRIEPWPLLGGRPGKTTRIELERNGEITNLPSKNRLDLKEGDILTIYTAGGAGYGPPEEREGERIAEDLRNGMVTAEAAMRDYGRLG